MAHFETVRKRKDGKQLDISATISPIKDSTGKIIGASKILRDISVSKRLTQSVVAANQQLTARAVELVALNNELEAFSYSVSHDLRAPLRAIDGFSSLCKNYDAQLGEEGRELTSRIRKAAQRMAGLIDDMLGLSRITRANLMRGHVDITALAKETAEELQASAPEQGAVRHQPWADR